MNLTYLFVTLILLAVLVTYIFAIIFFRRMYYVIEEIEARLIQIRDMIESQQTKDKRRAGVRPGSNRPSSHDTAYGR